MAVAVERDLVPAARARRTRAGWWRWWEIDMLAERKEGRSRARGREASSRGRPGGAGRRRRSRPRRSPAKVRARQTRRAHGARSERRCLGRFIRSALVAAECYEAGTSCRPIEARSPPPAQGLERLAWLGSMLQRPLWHSPSAGRSSVRRRRLKTVALLHRAADRWCAGPASPRDVALLVLGHRSCTEPSVRARSAAVAASSTASVVAVSAPPRNPHGTT